MISLSFRITVSNLGRTERFYRDGLGFRNTRVGTLEDGYILFQPEDASWEIIAEPWMKMNQEHPHLIPPDAPPDGAGVGVRISLLVANVDAKYKQACYAGGRSITPPMNTPEGERTAMIRDPDGYVVVLTGPVVESESGI